MTTPARRLFRPTHVDLLLAFNNVGQHRAKPLVLDDRRLIDLLPPVEDPVGRSRPLCLMAGRPSG